MYSFLKTTKAPRALGEEVIGRTLFFLISIRPSLQMPLSEYSSGVRGINLHKEASNFLEGKGIAITPSPTMPALPPPMPPQVS